jgi:YD repeat-containing protein
MIDAAGTERYNYDSRGNITSQTAAIGGVQYTTSYAYSLANRLTSMTLPSGRVIEYTRNLTGAVTDVSMRNSAGGTLVELTSGMAYAPFGDVTAISYSMPQAAGDMQTTITRDSQYRMQRLETGPGLIDRSYGYGFTGNITSIATNTADSMPEPQITSGTEQYGYAAGTNKLSEIDLLSGVGQNRSYLYDNNGNTLSDGTRTFT